MRHYFLIILLGLISFLSPAQDVVIPADAARYFLEQDDRAKLLTVKDSINQQIIGSINKELEIKNTIIKSYKNDSLDFRKIIANKDLQINIDRTELDAAQHLINSQKFEVSLFAGAAGGAIIGSVIPALGTVGGAVVGGVVGCGIYGIKKIKYLFKHE